MDEYWFSIPGLTTSSLFLIVLIPFLLIVTIIFLAIVLCCHGCKNDPESLGPQPSPTAASPSTRFTFINPFRRSRNKAFRFKHRNENHLAIKRDSVIPGCEISYTSKIPFYRGWNIDLENQTSL